MTKHNLITLLIDLPQFRYNAYIMELPETDSHIVRLFVKDFMLGKLRYYECFIDFILTPVGDHIRATSTCGKITIETLLLIPKDK